ncbi:MAG: hypothetical protein IJ683_06195 [Butyrivibrio sp.]|nr:hypothetical protein [Butyrivibrio sp.]MBR1641896.1 hypothetical protein [Butyrivibrio sp.]
MEKADISASDIYMKTFEKSVIDDDEYFGDLLEDSIKSIARDIREAHKKDWDTGDEEHITDKYLDSVKELWSQVNSSDSNANNAGISSNSDDEDELTQVAWLKLLRGVKGLISTFPN